MREIHVMASVNGRLAADHVTVMVIISKKSDSYADALEAGEFAMKEFYSQLRNIDCNISYRELSCGVVPNIKKDKRLYEYIGAIEFSDSVDDMYSLAKLMSAADCVKAKVEFKYENLSEKDSLIPELLRKAVMESKSRATCLAEIQGCRLGELMNVTHSYAWSEETCEDNPLMTLITVDVNTVWTVVE